MQYQVTAVAQTLETLISIRAGFSFEHRARYALAWLVGATLAQRRMIPNGHGIEALDSPDAWRSAHSVIGNDCAEIIWNAASPEAPEYAYEVRRAQEAIDDLLQRLPDFNTFVPDAFWWLATHRQSELGLLAPEACDLLFAVLGAPSGATIWIPFDHFGQLSARAVRLGHEINLTGLGNPPSVTQRLSLAVLGHFDATNMTSTAKSVYDGGDYGHEFDYLIAVPPIGAKGHLQPEWTRWASATRNMSHHSVPTELKLAEELRLDRPDTWVVATTWPRVRRRAVFLTAPSLLFSRGQEHRLRETWIRRNIPLDTIVSLPSGMYAHTGIEAALIAIDRNTAAPTVRMVDLTRVVTRSTKRGRLSKDLKLREALRLLEIRSSDNYAVNDTERDDHEPVTDQNEKQPRLIRNVPLEEIQAADYNLQPSRYLRLIPALTGPRKPLRELVRVLRAPVPTDDFYAVTAIELGIPNLGSWRPIVTTVTEPGGSARTVKVRERRLVDFTLTEGDIVISTKGTVGKTGLVGPSESKIDFGSDPSNALPLVTSGNCVALRVLTDKISPEYLLLYFRSKEFELQCDALRVGSVISHITPDDLLDSIKIPIPSPDQYARMLERYQRFCEHETRAETENKKIARLLDELWPVELDPSEAQ